MRFELTVVYSGRRRDSSSCASALSPLSSPRLRVNTPSAAPMAPIQQQPPLSRGSAPPLGHCSPCRRPLSLCPIAQSDVLPRQSRHRAKSCNAYVLVVLTILQVSRQKIRSVLPHKSAKPQSVRPIPHPLHSSDQRNDYGSVRHRRTGDRSTGRCAGRARHPNGKGECIT